MSTKTGTTSMAETGMAMAMAKAMVMMLPQPPILTMWMTTMVAIQGRQLDDGNWMTTMGQQLFASMMTATTAMAEVAKAMAMAMAMAMKMATLMMPPPLMEKMSMKTMAAIQQQQLDNGDWTSMMGQQECMWTMMVTTAMAETATAMATAKAVVSAMMPPLPPLATLLMKTMAEI
jgi:hypothetical protein